MKAKDPRDITVYTNVAPDGTIRWACQPMECAPRAHGNYYTRPDTKFDFRILWLPNQLREYVNTHLARSCRGRDCLYEYDIYTESQVWSERNMFHTDDQALRWLARPELK